MKHGLDEDLMVEVGLLGRSEKSPEPYDRFRGRVMFPLFSQVGQVVGFTGRLLEEDSKQAKYVNTPETKVYHKGRLVKHFDYPLSVS